MSRQLRNKARQPRHKVLAAASAERIDLKGTWEQLTLAESGRKRLQEVVGRLKHLRGAPESTGQPQQHPNNTLLLFVGPSGTGMALAAAMLARELDRHAYRIDLSRVVSKYIGETEKNLQRLFDAAEASGAILLFDEADALFGKGDQGDANHPDPAPVELNALLERIQSYRGVAIWAAHGRRPEDESLEGRFDGVIEFDDPD